MIINNNLRGINAYRNLTLDNFKASKVSEKLSSGLRINRAGDDAAGLAISEKMRAQINGLNQASRNIQDGISLIQTAEGGLNEVHSLLQRGRELSVQAANGTLNDGDRVKIQDEIEQIKKEVDRIANTTEFNTKKLLNEKVVYSYVLEDVPNDEKEVIEWLKKSWLKNSESRIKDYYGLAGDGVDMKFILENDKKGDTLAYVSYIVGTDGKAKNLEMHIDMMDFTPVIPPNGGVAPFYDDRTIVHELTHAVMGRTMNFGSLPKWFKEGCAEFIHGADERVKGDLTAKTAADIANLIGNGTDASWGSDSEHYSSAYSAVRYLHNHIKNSGGSGIKEVFDYLKNNSTATLDDALKNMAHGAYAGGVADFATEFKTNGAAFINSFDLDNIDTGAIGGKDVDGGAEISAESVVQDTIDGEITSNPLEGFSEIWPNNQTQSDELTEVSVGAESIGFQVGANIGQRISLNLINTTSSGIGIDKVDVTKSSSKAIYTFDRAIEIVSYNRSKLGAIQNRLEHALNVTQINAENTTASESRIRDTDMAKTMMEFTKNNILLQAAQSMLAQANTQPQAVLQLLK